MEVWGDGVSGEFAEGGEEVDEFGDGFATLIFGEAGRGDDEGDVGGDLVGGVLTPFAVVAEVVAVVSPEDDDGVLGEAGVIEGFHEAADLGVHEADGGAVAVDELAGFGVVEDFGIRGDVGVVFQLAPSGAVVWKSADDFSAGGDFDFVALIEVPVFPGGVEGEVGFVEADGEEEGFFAGGEFFHARDGGFSNSAVVVSVIADVAAIFNGGAVGAISGFFFDPTGFLLGGDAFEAGILASEPAAERFFGPALGEVVVVGVVDFPD